LASIFLQIIKVLGEEYTLKKFGHFSAIFRQIGEKFGRGFFRLLRFLWGHFCVLRPKYLPVGNTGTAALQSGVTQLP
jgi:hypothetical protein